MFKQSLYFAIAISALTLGGCGSVSEPAGPDEHTTQSVELGKAESVRVELKMPVGELDVRGGSPKLMDGDFTYNVPEWKPDIRYNSSGAMGDLVVEQRGSSSSTGNKRNHWDLHFNDKVPVDMRVQVGAGDARLNLGSLSLRTVNLEMGAGTLKLDLRGTPTKDYSVNLRGGVGEATVNLPKDVGISATVAGGLGDVSVSGLRKTDDHYENDAYAKAPVKIRLDIKGGVGTIKLIAE